MKKQIRALTLALLFALTLLPAAVFAEGDVASIGETGYATLADAVAAAKSGDTIKLLADVEEESVSIPDGVTLTINGTVEAANLVINEGGKVIVDGGTLTVTGTATNNGTISVSGTSDIAATVTGSGWVYMNGVTLDADTKLIGAKVRFASGTNNIDGSTIDDGFFQVGIGSYNGVDATVDTENGVTVNVKNAKIGSGGATYAGWVGTGFYDTDAEKAAAMTDAKYTLNIENSVAEFGYLHVSNDGVLNVTGNAAEKAHYNNSDYSFYAGDFIINGTATFDATDALALYTKVSCDNGTDKPGTLNIVNGAEYEAERHNGAIDGTNFILYKTGVVNANANLHIGEYTSIAADAKLNIGGTVTALGTITNNGTITMTAADATLTTPEAPTVVSGVAAHIAAYENGAYKLIAGVAQIGDKVYGTLAAAVAACDGETITMLKDVTISEKVTVSAGKTVTLDLNGKIIDGTEKTKIALMSYGNLTLKDSSEAQTGAIKAGVGTAGNAVNICGGTFTMESGSIYSKNNGILIDEQAAQVTIQGGTITAEPSTKNSAVMYISSTSDTTVTISGGEMVGYNGILLWDNTTITMTGGSIDAQGSLGIQGNGSKDNTEISISGDAEITGYYAAIYHPQGGKLTIADNAKLSGWSGVVHKGGELIISGGTIAGTGAADDYKPVSSGFADTGDALYTEQYDNSPNSEHYGPSKVTITGGTFTSVNGYAVASYANPNNDVTRSEGFISAGTFIGAKAMDEALLVDGVVLNQDGTVKTPAYAGPAMNAVKINPCTNGTVKAGPLSASEGATVTLYTKADTGYKLAGVTVLDKNGALVKVTDGKFQMPAGGVTVTATFVAQEAAAHPFTDLAGYESYEDAIAYCYQNGLMVGTSASTFGPAGTLDRAQVVTVLHRLAGTPAAAAPDFTDVPADAYYTAAVGWAAENGITLGYGNGLFGSSDDITVEQLVAFLHRFEQLKSGAITETSLASAMAWAQAQGLFGDMTVTGTAPAARCQTALVLMNYLTK